MAKYKGQVGDVTVGGSSVGERISFSIEFSAATADASVMGSGWSDVEDLQHSAQGELEVFYDPNDAQQTALGLGAEAVCVFQPAGSTTGLEEISGTFLVERVGISTSVGDLVKTTYTIRNKGVVTRTTIS